MANRKRLWIVLAFIALLWVSTNYILKPSASSMQDKSRTVLLVRGYIATTVNGGPNQGTTGKQGLAHDVFLPGVKVFLKDLLTGTDTDTVTTDLSGRFTIRAPRPSRYRVCWKAEGFAGGCSENIFSVGNGSLHLGTLRIAAERNDRTTVLFGQVTMKDGSSPRTLSPLANVNAFASVALLDSSKKTIQQVVVNNFGEYLMPRVPVKQTITLRAQVENATKEQLILPEANLDKAAFHPVNLAIGNTPPRLDPLIPGDNAGRRVKVASPGSLVRLAARASDAEGDALKFKWVVPDGSGTLSAIDTPQVTWTLPPQPGRYSVTLLASDGKGGYAQSSVSLRAGDKTITFSGVVDSTLGAPVNGAEVEVNGQTAITNGTGFFMIRVRDATRFVFNVRKTGFGLVSRIYDNGVTGGHWTMTRATVRSLDPTKGGEIVNERTPRDCPGPRANQINWRDFPQLRNAQWQDGKGNVIAPPRRSDVPLPLPQQQSPNPDNPCGPGIRVNISPNALVDERGRAPVGNVDIAVSTIDLRSPEQMPGDYTVNMPDGTTRVMQSYGAGGVEITGGGHRYNLRPGATAKVTIPIDASQLAAGGPIPAAIPILFYNERTGAWTQDGSASRVGNNYVATVKHFSTINTDLVKTNQACVEVLSPTLPAFYDLEVTIPMGGGAAPRVITRTIDNSSPSDHVLYNLPTNTNIVLVPIDTSTTPPTPIGTFIVNTGGQQNPTSPNLPVLVPGQGYIACSTRVTLTNLAVPDVPLSGEFLHGLYSFEATNLDEGTLDPALKTALDTASANYYQQVDPRGKRLTLSEFKSTNGFPGGEIHAVYANSGDLGFGRDMHCVKKLASDGSFDVACYVTNYGDINTPDAQDAADAVAGTNPVATVAMEYSRIENPADPEFDGTNTDRTVKFYVYVADPNIPGETKLARAANLDGLGARPIPQLCMVCHGGEYPGGAVIGAAPGFNNRDDVKLQARFLPFDLHYYTFAPAPNDKATQQPFFKQLNEDIVKNTPPDPTIAEIITKMYAGGAIQDENFVVPGWNANAGQQAMYREVVARTCRTCHAANIFLPNLKLDQASQFIGLGGLLGSAENRICIQHVMPHAKRTHEIFWKSVGPHIPAQFEAFGVANPVNGWQGDKCGSFTGGGTTPPSLYSTTVQPIFDLKCTACHLGGGSAPQGLDLTAGVSHGLLVNVNSGELPAMKRVKPNDVANSYLIHKVEGTQAGVGGSGGKMPLGCSGGSCLSTTQIDAIKNWINAGAPPP